MILNLTNTSKSIVRYRINNYPDGQKDVTILTSYITAKQLREDFRDLIEAKAITIYSRLTNFEQLNLIISATQALRRVGVQNIQLYVPYLLGGRSDRMFVEGGVSYLVDVLAPIINAQNYQKVMTFDVHNPSVADACIKNFVSFSNKELVVAAFKHWFKDETFNVTLVAPDDGAGKKIWKLAKEVEFTQDIAVCMKDRNSDGLITKTVFPLPFNKANERKDFVIIDDICDGGATFINIAKAIRKKQLKGKIYLIVTHGIFSKGDEELVKWFDGIYTTNSYKEFDPLDTFIKHKKVI